ncbi:arginine deiminase [Anaerosphaera multitolerans]|uniref:Arginine deiminase n=1 Tax=Anaerosphaera multitolerans TaxID=2487351 RepID=A0A437S5G9_9FIRM|nr:arginine deiminase [Anaerosphaera multitolerans]RVU54156.1 arginine deiminase [Anaerosphaera multitolerans]
MAVINVTSEINPLEKVLIHRPGRELLNLTPDTLEKLLFDDIPFLKRAQEEHDAFAEILRDEGIEVVYLEDLMAETLTQNKDLRETFLKQFITEGGIHSPRFIKIIYEFLNSIEDNKDLVLKTMEGININELQIGNANSLVDMVYRENSKMILDPMPNLFFTRDPFASIGNGIALNKMYSQTRSRETIYGHYIFKYHKEFKNKVDMLYARDLPFHIEGGDILNINESTLAVGISQRTEPNAIELLAKNIFFNSNSKIERIIAFDIPKKRAFMHLDTVLTQIDIDKFTVHPIILENLKLFELTKSNKKNELKVIEIENELENVLSSSLEIDVELIPCGGGDEIVAAREQWSDGSNTLCIKPGTIIVYERNDVTNDLLSEKGLNLLVMPSAELSRGRGGPRCMSMPLVRENNF